MIRRVRSNIVPSYQGRYARNASESAAPWWWRGLAFAGVPALGATGEVLRDVSPARFDGTHNGAAWVPGTLRLNDGGYYYVTLPDVTFTTAMTACIYARVYRTASEDWHLFSRHPQWFIARRDASGGIRAVVNTGTESEVVLQAAASIDSAWHSFAMTYDGAALRGYLDGLQTNAANKTGTITTGGNTRIGTYWGDVTGYDAPVDVAVAMLYNRALTPSEIQELAADPLVGLRPKRRVIYSIPAGANYDVYTPSSRIYTVAAQVRTYTVPAQDRTYDVPAQDRTYDVEV